MKDSYTTYEKYSLNAFNEATVLAPIISAMAAVTFTVARILGYFETVGFDKVAVFDAIWILYAVIALYLRKSPIEEDGTVDMDMLHTTKVILFILVVFQWNVITYFFQANDFWGFAPLFVLITSIFVDSKLVLCTEIGIAVSTAVSWILKPKTLLPVAGAMYYENMVLRIIALCLTFGIIYYVVRYIEGSFGRISEYTSTLKKSSAREEKDDTRKGLEGLVILCVDDNSLTMEINKEILSDEGAQVVEAMSGTQAVELFRTCGKFDAVLMDLTMPVMDGIEATREIRKLEAEMDSQTPIIALTGEKDESKISAVLEAGANDCLGKPLVVSELSSVLMGIMKNRSDDIGKKLEETIRSANTDALTGVKNLTAYTAKIADLTEKMKAAKRSFYSVVMVDINNLKKMNDTNGHLAGDIYIRNCTNLLSDVFGMNPIYRIGGDEFAVILEGTGFMNRQLMMDRIVEKNEKASRLDGVENGYAYISVGISDYDPETDISVSDVVRRADEAMYIMKKKSKETRS